MHTTAEIAAAQEGAKPAAGEEKSRAAVAVDASYSASVFFDPHTKYIWALELDKSGQFTLALATVGDLSRQPNGNGSIFFQSDEAQIRCLALDNSGNLIAGTDGSGLVYRISSQGEAFVLYSAPKKEITALAIDAQGNIYAAGAGEKRGGTRYSWCGAARQSARPRVTLIPQSGQPPQTPSPSLAPLSAPSLMANLGGSEVYRISPEGSPRTLWCRKKTSSMRWHSIQQDVCLPGPATRERFTSSTASAYTDLVKASANQVTAFAQAPQGGMYAATSNLGKIFQLGPGTAAEGTYESDVYDAHIFSKWGRSTFAATASSTSMFAAAMSIIPIGTGALEEG